MLNCRSRITVYAHLRSTYVPRVCIKRKETLVRSGPLCPGKKEEKFVWEEKHVFVCVYCLNDPEAYKYTSCIFRISCNDPPHSGSRPISFGSHSSISTDVLKVLKWQPNITVEWPITKSDVICTMITSFWRQYDLSLLPGQLTCVSKKYFKDVFMRTFKSHTHSSARARV